MDGCDGLGSTSEVDYTVTRPSDDLVEVPTYKDNKIKNTKKMSGNLWTPLALG